VYWRRRLMRMTIAAMLTAMAFDTGTAARHWAER
jgi:hypothetical protein